MLFINASSSQPKAIPALLVNTLQMSPLLLCKVTKSNLQTQAKLNGQEKERFLIFSFLRKKRCVKQSGYSSIKAGKKVAHTMRGDSKNGGDSRARKNV